MYDLTLIFFAIWLNTVFDPFALFSTLFHQNYVHQLSKSLNGSMLNEYYLFCRCIRG